MKIGVVGWGDIGRHHASHFSANGAELGAVVSRRRDLELDVPVFQTLSEMAPHVDAITVAVPNHLHAPMCLQAIAAGKPVLVEKPLCISKSELAELEKSFENLTVSVHLGFRLRWNRTLQTLKSRLANPRRIKCIYRMGIEKLARDRDWTRQLALTGGGFFTLGVHALDITRWLAGAGARPLEGLQAGATHRDDSADYPLDVWVSGTLPNGVEIVAGTDLRGDADSRIALEIDAERGHFPDGDLPRPVPADEPAEYAALIADFIRAVEANAVDEEDAVAVLQTHRELLMARDATKAS